MSNRQVATRTTTVNLIRVMMLTIDPPVVDTVAGEVNIDTDWSDGADRPGVLIALFRANYICERVCYRRNYVIISYMYPVQIIYFP